MPISILSYNKASQGAKTLSTAFSNEGIPVTRYGPVSPAITALNDRGAYLDQTDKTMLIKWGNIRTPAQPETCKKTLMLNFGDTTRFTDKKKFYETFSETIVPIPNHFTRAVDAQAYLQQVDNKRPYLVERNVLSGHSGEGIRLLTGGDAVTPSAKLWTYYIPKKYEFRLHFVKLANGDYRSFVQVKLLKKGLEKPEAATPNRFQVRNLDNGWVYGPRNTDDVPEAVYAAASVFIRSALNTLDFGAIDIIYNEGTNAAYILEVNTAPGLASSVTGFYLSCFKEMYNSHDFTSTKTKYTVAS